eukprot:TRINITY_DN9526_c1_g1_i4.p1 TRINITY_DN9526_c1_g1~~TRINITY_DN9526_c1_g1_i4.p1  ORF type:complete len:367 (-),score=27.39 TRINITY_DN9526_c1_g1_i4:398-1498(-)
MITHSQTRGVAPHMTIQRSLTKVRAVATPAKTISPSKVSKKEFYTTKDGRQIEVLHWDYGFRSGVGRLYQEGYGQVPSNVFTLAWNNFVQEAKNLVSVVNMFRKDPRQQMDEEDKIIYHKLQELTLDDKAVKAREERMAEQSQHAISTAPEYIKWTYRLLCETLDFFYKDRPIARFWTLEVVARIPYFAYTSMLHLYESLGWWRAGATLRKLHFAEEWNELHHLQIMETLGGDHAWFDRFVAYHSAVVYYWLVIVYYLISPKHSYHFMEMVEGHARDTYAEFILQNQTKLADLLPPRVACEYYLSKDLYMFDSFQMTTEQDGTHTKNIRRPSCETLLDVFNNIRDDEMEHVKTMDACKEQTIASQL